MTTIGASVCGRARWMNENPSMPPSIRSTSIRSTPRLGDRFEGLLGIGCLDDVIALVLQHQAKRRPQAVVVLEHQEPSRHADHDPTAHCCRAPCRRRASKVIQLQ